jgi:hypothetical protein
VRNRAATWRSMAQQAKAIAARMPDPHSRQVMEEIAERYEALAVYAEEKALPEHPGQPEQG